MNLYKKFFLSTIVFLQIVLLGFVFGILWDWSIYTFFSNSFWYIVIFMILMSGIGVLYEKKLLLQIYFFTTILWSIGWYLLLKEKISDFNNPEIVVLPNYILFISILAMVGILFTRMFLKNKNP